MSSDSHAKNSIFMLAYRHLPSIRFDFVNFIVPPGSGLILLMLAMNRGTVLQSESLTNSIGNLLQFNGALLGLLMAGFGIYSAVPANRHTIFSIVNAADGSENSYFKARLLTIFKMAFWSFLCTASMSFIYVMVALDLIDVMPYSDEVSQRLKQALVVGCVGWLQVKIFVELKVYVYSVFVRAMTEARLVAISDGKIPFDKSSD